MLDARLMHAWWLLKAFGARLIPRELGPKGWAAPLGPRAMRHGHAPGTEHKVTSIKHQAPSIKKHSENQFKNNNNNKKKKKKNSESFCWFLSCVISWRCLRKRLSWPRLVDKWQKRNHCHGNWTLLGDRRWLIIQTLLRKEKHAVGKFVAEKLISCDMFFLGEEAMSLEQVQIERLLLEMKVRRTVFREGC